MSDFLHKKDPEFWVINTSPQKDITINDLGFTLKRLERKNLLDKKRFNLTMEQIKKSVESGSIFSRRKEIAIREFIPVKTKLEIPNVVEVVKSKEPLKPLRHPAFKEIEIPRYEELDFDDVEESERRQMEEQIAAEQAEFAMQDRAPSLAVDKKFESNE